MNGWEIGQIDYPKICDEYGSELINNLYSRNVSVCSNCLQLQKINNEFTDGHSQIVVA
jgi:hypothetical protein